MKKIILFSLIFTILMIGLVSAAPKHFAIFNDHAPSQDIVHIADLQSWAEENIDLNFQAIKLSELTKTDLKSAISVYIYNSRALIFISDDAPASDLVLVTDISTFLVGEDLVSGSVVIEVSELESEDLEEAMKKYDDYFKVSICTDSDGGKNYLEKGTTVGLNSLNKTKTLTDYCVYYGQEGTYGAYLNPGEKAVIEYVCNSDGKTVNDDLHVCGSYGCDNGKCLERDDVEDVVCEIDFYYDMENDVNCAVEYNGVTKECTIKADDEPGNQCILSDLYITKPSPDEGYIGVDGLSGDFKGISCGKIETSYNTNRFFVNCKPGEVGFEGGMDKCLDKGYYWDQETDKCQIERQKCSDPDVGKDYGSVAHTFGFRKYSTADDPEKDLRIRTGGKDSCLSEDKLREYYCVDDYYIASEIVVCGDYCNDEGRCIGGIDRNVIVSPTEESGPVDLPEEIEDVEDLVSVCGGCVLEDKCYPFGYRKSGDYCLDNGAFVEQLESEEICENNFECGSNVCVSGQCVSEGLLQRIISWFKNLFG